MCRFSGVGDVLRPWGNLRNGSGTLDDVPGFSGYPQYSQAKVQKIGGSKIFFAPAVWKFHAVKFVSSSYDFTKVTAPSEAEETSAAYFENTPRL